MKVYAYHALFLIFIHLNYVTYVRKYNIIIKSFGFAEKTIRLIAIFIFIQAGLFSFEVGRKTPTGPGVYAFKCRRAEKLFNLLQVRVREQGPDRTSMSMASTPGF